MPTFCRHTPTLAPTLPLLKHLVGAKELAASKRAKNHKVGTALGACPLPPLPSPCLCSLRMRT